jgi:hypothetical protein
VVEMVLGDGGENPQRVVCLVSMAAMQNNLT